MMTKVKNNKKPTLAEMNSLSVLFNQNRLSEVLPLALSLTQKYPNHEFGWKALGAIRKNQNLLPESIAAFEVAVGLVPKDAEAHHNLGNCYFDLGDYPNAELNYKNAVELEPDFALAQFNLAFALRHQGKFVEAESHYKSAIRIAPRNAMFYINLADMYYEKKSFESAIDYYQQAIKLTPADAVLYVSLGASFKALMQFDNAEKAYKKALELNPSYALVYSNQADMLNEQGRFLEAKLHCERAIEIAPEFSKAYSNLAMALQNIGQFDEATVAFKRAIELDPKDVGTLSNFSIMLIAQNQFTQAEIYLKQVIFLNPSFAAAYINLALNYIYQGQIEEAEVSYLKALDIEPESVLAKSGLLFSMNYSSKYSIRERLLQAQEYNKLVEGKVKTVFTTWLNTAPTARLRVGLVSGDLRQHAVAYFLDNVIRYFDSSKIELIAYSTNAREDTFTDRLKPYFSSWKSLVGLSDENAAILIHDDGVQVLIDLSGHSSGNRLPIFASKPAPVQVSWLGYFATTGLNAMDYFIADKIGVPISNHGQFVEKIKYLPDTRLCFSVPDVEVAVSPLPALANQYVTFGSFQNTAKVGDDVLMLWAQVLKALPNARLRLQSKALGDAAVAEKILERLVNCGIDPKVVSMHGFVSRQGYLEAHAEIDMILDTFPFNGGTTTCEALWMGVPTLTVAGDNLIARQGASMLSAAGLGDWIASDAGDFVNKAIAFAQDTHFLADLRGKLRAQVIVSPLFDGQLFARNMEQALVEMWQESGFRVVNEGEMKEPHIEVQYQPLTKEAYELSQRDKFKQKIHVISATRYSENDFWVKSALGISLQKQIRQDTRLSASIAFENSRGLSEVFNENIKKANDEAMLVFIHDDVWIDETYLADAVINGLDHFDVIGVAGNKRRVPNQPAWPFLDTNFTWDERSNLSGKVAHGQQAFGAVSDFGDVPAECELMDGVFLAAKKSTLVANHVEFDPQFDFHFYDLDFCRTAKQAGLRLGTWLVRLTHQSGGAFGSPQWVQKYQQYLSKWEVVPNKDRELQNAMNDVLQMAIEHQQAGQLEQAEILYQEILKIQPENAEANHNLGVIEAHTKDATTALLRLERAVQTAPENEQYWVSYIDALMQSGATESAIDALELGQQYGLRPETAQALAAEFVSEMELKTQQSQVNSDAISSKALTTNTGMIATLIPAYKTDYLADLLQSLVLQTYKKFSVIISDDSPDNRVTQMLLSPEFSKFTQQLNLTIIDGPKLGKNHENIRHLLNVWNNQTELVHFLFDDDVIYPTFYAMHARVHLQSDTTLSVSKRWYADANGMPIEPQLIPENFGNLNVNVLNISQLDLATSTIPNCNNWLGEYSNVVFKSSAVGMLSTLSVDDVSIYGLGDIGSFIFASDNVLWINEYLGFFRRHGQQITGQIDNPSFKAGHLAWVSLAIVALNRRLIDLSGFHNTLSIMHRAIANRYPDEIEMMQFNRLIADLILNIDKTPDFLSEWKNFIFKNGFN